MTRWVRASLASPLHVYFLFSLSLSLGMWVHFCVFMCAAHWMLLAVKADTSSSSREPCHSVICCKYKTKCDTSTYTHIDRLVRSHRGERKREQSVYTGGLCLQLHLASRLFLQSPVQLLCQTSRLTLQVHFRYFFFLLLSWRSFSLTPRDLASSSHARRLLQHLCHLKFLLLFRLVACVERTFLPAIQSLATKLSVLLHCFAMCVWEREKETESVHLVRFAANSSGWHFSQGMNRRVWGSPSVSPPPFQPLSVPSSSWVLQRQLYGNSMSHSCFNCKRTCFSFSLRVCLCLCVFRACA